jgi:AbrB family looped-hinge helix DNA binding protein
MAPPLNVRTSVLNSYQPSIDRITVMPARDTAKLSAKFQISIPKGIRTARGWQAGQVFAFIPKGEGMLLVPVPELDELSGLARGAKTRGYRDRTDRV